MMYQMTPSYQPELNHIQQYSQVPNMGMQPTIHMSQYMQQVPQQVSPVPCISLDARTFSAPHMQQVPQQVSPVPCISLDARTFSTAQLPMSSPMSLNDHQSHTSTPLSYSPQLQGWNLNHQTIVPPLTLNDDMVYRCNFLGQLQGSYEIETPAGQDQVSVIVPTLSENEEQYAIVRIVCSDGEALPDQFIYQEQNRFTLCSVNGDVDAELRRGCNMKHTVKWENVHNGSQIVWRRKGEVTFNLVSVDSLAPSRRNSISSVGTGSTALSSCVNSPLIDPNGMPMQIRPELLQHCNVPQSRPILMSTPSCGSFASNESFQTNLSNHQESSVDAQVDNQEQAMFELIKAHCVGNSSLLKRMVHWAMRNRTMRRVSAEDINTISEGRLWVTAHPFDFVEGAEIEESLQESLEDIKGAYMEVRKGVYKQPEPQLNEPGVQHRLTKDSRGCWKIEGYHVDSGIWEMCAKELADGRWVDMKNNGKAIRVQLIPMSKILQQLDDEFSSENQEVEKSMEFLFTSCNQKKLNSKLKGRNLKHNISNLKVKLEKQYALRFAVQVATTADSIAQELDVLR